jgi:hypothetical protein
MVASRKAHSALAPGANQRTARSWGYACGWLFFAEPGNYKRSTQIIVALPGRWGARQQQEKGGTS